MKLLNNIMYFEFDELVALGINEVTIRQGYNRKSSNWQKIDDPEDKRKVLVQHDTLHEKYKKLITEKYGNPLQYLETQKAQHRLTEKKQATLTLPEKIKVDTAELELLTKKYGEKDGSQYARACAWLRLCLKVKGAKTAKEYGFESKREMLQAILEHLKTEDLKGLKAGNLSVLKRKYRAYKKEGSSAIAYKHYGNGNSRKLNKEQQLYIEELYSDHRKLLYPQITAIYNNEALFKGWKQVTAESIRQYISRPDVQQRCWSARHGKSLFHNDFSMVTGRKRPAYPDDLWVMDGTPLELYYHEGSNWWNRFYSFFVVDAHSWKIIGYALGQSETEDLVYQAIKMACKLTNARPHQLQFDNSSAIKSKDMMEWYKNISNYITPAAVGNARAKVIEAITAHFNRDILKFHDNHSGGNITAKKEDTFMNREFLIENKKVSIPPKEKVQQQIHEAIALWNARTIEEFGASPNELYSTLSPRRQELTLEQWVSCFWKWRIADRKTKERLAYTYGTSGINIQYNKQQYRYIVYDAEGLFDLEFHQRYVHDKFFFKYDPDDMSSIRLYQDDKFIAIAQLEKEVPMAIVDYKEGDGERIQRLNARKKEIRESVLQQRNADSEKVAALGMAKVTLGGYYKEEMNAAEQAMKQLETVGYVASLPPQKEKGKAGKKFGLYDNGQEGGVVE